MAVTEQEKRFAEYLLAEIRRIVREELKTGKTGKK